VRPLKLSLQAIGTFVFKNNRTVILLFAKYSGNKSITIITTQKISLAGLAIIRYNLILKEIKCEMI